MSYSAYAIANYFLDLAAEKGAKLSPMKLQKLVYFAHGWHLALFDKPLINEQVEAWRYGPVIKSLYHSLKGFGNQPVDAPIVRRGNHRAAGRLVSGVWTPGIDEEAHTLQEAAATKKFLRQVWDIYGDYTPVQLSNLTHVSGTPWDRVYKFWNQNPPKGTDIPQDWMREYFAGLAKG